MEKIYELREKSLENPSLCPVCDNPLKYNVRTGRNGQWAHFICDTKTHRKVYGKKIVESNYNGVVVCDLECNNSVQLNRKSRPVLCDELAEDITHRQE